MIKENSSNSQVTHAGRMRLRKGSNEVPADAGQANGKNLLVNDQNKYRSMLIRAYSSIWMIGGFIFVVYMGNHYIWAMVVILQTFMIKELFGLLRKANEDKQLPTKASKGSPKPAVGPSATGPVTEEEITAVLMHKAPVTTLDLVAKFKSRLRTKEDKNAFADILRRIAKIPKTNGPNYVVLRNK